MKNLLPSNLNPQKSKTKRNPTRKFFELTNLVEVNYGRISLFRNQVETLEKTVVVLESTLKVSQNKSNRLSAELGNLHQYS